MAKRKKKKAPLDPYIERCGDHITIGNWKGLSNYECVHCAHATPTPVRAWEHLRDVHLAGATRATVDTGLVTESGEPIGRPETEDEAAAREKRDTEPAKED